VGEVFKGQMQSNKPEIKLNGVVIDDDEIIADKFACFFKGKVDDLLTKSRVVSNLVQDYPTEDEPPFSEFEIKKAIDQLKYKKSCGCDELPMCLIKDVGPQIVKPLCTLFNACLRDSWFPDAWKLAKVIPIHKKGSVSDIENYRPISNLSSLSKVLEKCILMRLLKSYLDMDYQHGFRNGHSTTTAALEAQHYLSQNLDNRKCSAVYSLDMSAAFDLLRPEIMENKLSGVKNNLKKLVMNFLTDRRAFVQYGDEVSLIFRLNAGVPQGSVLGPKLFTIYTNGLSEAICLLAGHFRSECKSEQMDWLRYAKVVMEECRVSQELMGKWADLIKHKLVQKEKDAPMQLE